MKSSFKLNAISIAVLSSFMAYPAMAQETSVNDAKLVEKQIAENKANQTAAVDDELEIIEVTGFRGSLQKALNAKRFSENVSDSIHAEDVGKSTDQNIADALSRVTGISIQSENGEGTRISVRGTGPSMNQIQVNGVSLTSGLSGDGSNPTASQSVDLSSFSSDILSSIDVIKTSSADQDEGSLGATVVLRTVKPLQLRDARRSLNIEGRFDEYSGENTERITGSFADKYLDDTLGFVITVSKDTQKTRQDRLNTNWVTAAIPIVDLYSSSGRTAHDIASGKAIRILGEGQTTADLLNWDPDTQIAHDGPLDVTARNFTDISTSSDIRERFSVSAGIEWQPTSATNIQFDVTHTKQDVETDYHNFRLNFAALTGVSGADPVTDWNGVDLETNTLEQSYSRKSGGFFNRTQGLRELNTDVASLEIKHDITDTLRMGFVAGISKTTDKTKNHVGLTTATWGTLGNTVIEAVPMEDIEPIGHDCSGSNGDCSFTLGTKPAIFDPFDGSVSYVSSSFNPFDLEANHLGGLTFRNNDQSDTNKSLHLDFEWDLDRYNITSIEFGAKYAKRVKDVYTQNQTVNTGTALVDNITPDVNYATVGMQSIGVIDMLSGEAFPYDNFGEDLVSDRSNAYFGGWPMLDAEKAIAEFSGRDPSTVGVSKNNLGTRNIETETNALYGKVNFEGFDGRLTGNVGLRYIKDTNTANGYGGITYYRPPHLLDPYNLLIERGLGDIEGSPACPTALMGIDPSTGLPDTRWEPQNSDQLSNCFAWALTHGYDYNNDATTPYVDGQWVLPGGVDTNRLVYIDYSTTPPTVQQLIDLPNQITDVNGNLVNASALTHRQFANVGEIWPFLDRSTSFVGPNGDQDSSYIRQAPTSGTAKHSLLLPSLNLNYAINEEMIGRFAVSKTMTRPEFDSLNPRLQMDENVWGPAASGVAGNVNLKPLKSKNLDLSFEWYFDASGMLSTALFYKKMTDFPETVVTTFNYLDVRSEYDLQSANLLLDYDENRVPGDADNCMPHRYVGGFGASSWKIECHKAEIAIEKNGQGADVRGIEIGYTQNYTFLPGIWSGLGMSVNYTYQQSEKEIEEVGTTGVFTKPLPQAYTPEQSANSTIFYEKYGLTLRLAHRYASEQLINDGLHGGAIWQEATSNLDFSSSYQINKNLSVSFQAINLTDEVIRNYYTTYNKPNEAGDIVLDEGNALDGNVPTNRTAAVFKNGRQFRIGLRGSF
ncbi:TonB-dependent receptor [Paraglaciecola hydrolytica]|uniref:TonB-dependent receptor n=1 Tax=Paraglaciecola hydrolytica TaxID=1799789 RepID=A0A136A0Z7_9ALTE|nr:TonB-dependent receptor [Paraglaciecola hydrolytica]KXI28873.1 TonB-dependent receptor [Paraglaciecola hydrolytica]